MSKKILFAISAVAFMLFFIAIKVLVPEFQSKECKNVVFDTKDEGILNYSFNIGQFSSVEKALSNQKYVYGNENSKYIAIISYSENSAKMKQVKVNNGDEINVEINKGEKFIVSLPANRTVACTWDVENSSEKVINKQWLEIPLPEKYKNSTGVSFNRQNFYFVEDEKSNRNLNFIYHEDSAKTGNNSGINNFNFKVRVNVILK